MKLILRFLQIVYSIYAILLFVILMLIVVPFILLFSLFGEKTGGNLVYTACRTWAVVWYFLIFIRHKEIYTENFDKNKQYIFIANHQSYLDIPELLRATHQPIRVLGKHDLAKIPIFGIIYKSAAILVDRGNRENRAQSIQKMKTEMAKGLSIFIFPEGTFNESDKPLKNFFDGAFRIAIETGTPIQPIIFLDTLKRFHHRGLFEFTPGICRSVYLPVISVTDYNESETARLKSDVFIQMQNAIIEFAHAGEHS